MADDSREYTTRTYIKDDETTLVRLFNSEHANLAGFVPRTVEYWLWCCLKRPDVNEKGIPIIEKQRKIVGYAVVGKSGNVWELCYSSLYDSKAIVSKLLEWILCYARRIGSDSVVLNAYAKDKIVREVCQEMDFAETPPEPVFLSVLDLPHLIARIMETKVKYFNSEEEFQFNLSGCPSWCNDFFCIKIKNNKVYLTEKPASSSSITIETNMSTLINLIFGNGSISKAIIVSKVRFRPIWKIFKAHRLLSLFQIKTPWFVPRADLG